ncbi:MAG TPA: TlpA disulfide reductase family protein [Anaeromyxobacter sp.]
MTPRLLALPVALLAAAGGAAAQDGAPAEELQEGLPAPAFSLRTLNPEASGETWIALDRFVGEEAEDPGARVVVISFFASWCEPCRRELPFLVQLDRMYRERGLRVLAVNVDREEAGIEAARRMIAEARVAYPVLSDRFNFLARRYLGDRAPLPSVFLVRRDGTIARIERGYARDASQFLLGDVQAALGLAPSARSRSAAEPPKAR